MKTTKLTRITQTIEEIEVPIPYYVKFGHCQFGAIFDEHTAISVTFSKVSNSSVAIVRPDSIMNQSPKQISRHEFDDVFQAAMEDINFTLKTNGKQFKN